MIRVFLWLLCGLILAGLYLYFLEIWRIGCVILLVLGFVWLGAGAVLSEKIEIF